MNFPREQLFCDVGKLQCNESSFFGHVIDKVQKIILSVCRALEFSPAQANQALTERLVRELAPV